MIQVAVAQNYARALYRLSRERGLEELVLSGLNHLELCLQEEDRLKGILNHPLVDGKDKKSILRELFSPHRETPGELLHFLFLLVDRKRVAEIEEVIKRYRQAYQQDRDIQMVEVVTPHELKEEQREEIVKNMRKFTGKEVVLEEKRDPSLNGGVILKMGSRMLDGSLDTRLKRLEEHLMQVGGSSRRQLER